MLVRIGNTLIRLLLKKQSDLGLSCLSGIFGRQLMFEIIEQLPYVNYGTNWDDGYH